MADDKLDKFNNISRQKSTEDRLNRAVPASANSSDKLDRYNSLGGSQEPPSENAIIEREDEPTDMSFWDRMANAPFQEYYGPMALGNFILDLPNHTTSMAELTLVDMENRMRASQQGHSSAIYDIKGNRQLNVVDPNSKDGMLFNELGINPNAQKYVTFIDPITKVETLYERNPDRELGYFGRASEGAGFIMYGLATEPLKGAAKAISAANKIGRLEEGGRRVGMSIEETTDTFTQDMHALTNPTRLQAQLMAEEFLSNAKPTKEALAEADIASTVQRYRDAAKEIPNLSELDINSKAAWLEKRLSNTRLPAKPGSSHPVGYYLDFLEDSYEATHDNPVINPSRFKEIPLKTAELFLDKDIKLKSKLLNSAGDAGIAAVRDFELMAGATTNGVRIAKDVTGKVFAGMSKADRKTFESFVRARRDLEIRSYKPAHAIGTDANISTKSIQQDFTQLVEDLGPEKAAAFRIKSDILFGAHKQIVQKLRRAGILSEDEVDKLNQFIYTPTEFIREIDPAVTYQAGKHNISVSSSGLEPLKGGALERVVMDSEKGFLEAAIRAESRIFRNRASRSLAIAAQTYPDNGVVSPNKTNGWAKLHYLDEGKKQTFYVHPDYVDNFVRSPKDSVSQMLGTITGTKLLKALATGNNPAVAPVLFWRDMSFVIQNTQHFSSAKPKAYLQLASDLAATRKDAFSRTGAFDSYLEQGGGMQLLTHQGRLGDTTLQNSLQRLQHILGWVNETSEIWMRLAVRNRALRNGASEIDATWAARNYIDFSQAGTWGRTLDAFIPYFNASVQGWRTTGRAIKGAPVDYTAKAGQTMSMFVMMNVLNRSVNADARNETSRTIEYSSLVLNTPFSRRDEKGNVRHLLVRVPLEHTMVPWKLAADMMTDYYYDGKLPDKAMINAFKASTQALPSTDPLAAPLLDGMLKTVGNYDWWQTQPVWKGDKILPGDEIKVFPDTPTSELAQDVGAGFQTLLEPLSDTPKEFGITSPERLEAAAGGLTAGNFYASSMASLYQIASTDDPERPYDTTNELLTNVPGLNKFFYETHPLAKTYDDLDLKTRQANSRRNQLNSHLDSLVYAFEGDEVIAGKAVTRGDIQKYIKNSTESAAEVQRLQERWDNARAAWRIFRDMPSGTPGILDRDQWVALTAAPPEVRASEFWRLEQDAKGDEIYGKARLATLRKIRSQMPGFAGDQFTKEYMKLSRQRE